MRFARRNEAEPRVAAIDNRAIERVRTRERERRRQLVVPKPALLIVRRVGPANVEAAERNRKFGRHDVQRLRQ
jgi:hypothetical protein